MDISVRTNVSNEFNSVEVVVNTPELNSDIQNLINTILNSTNELKEIIGMQDNKISIIKLTDVIMFYSEEKDIFCKTSEGNFKIKEKLYQLEDILPRSNFIRISNSVIINVEHVKHFDVSLLGRIVVKFKDDTYDYVAQRRVSEVMKFLKNRRR